MYKNIISYLISYSDLYQIEQQKQYGGIRYNNPRKYDLYFQKGGEYCIWKKRDSTICNKISVSKNLCQEHYNKAIQIAEQKSSQQDRSSIDYEGDYNDSIIGDILTHRYTSGTSGTSFYDGEAVMRVQDDLRRVGKGLSSIAGVARGAASRVGDGLSGAASRVGDGLSGAASRVGDGLSGAASSLGDGLSGAASSLGDATQEALASVSIPKPSLPDLTNVSLPDLTNVSLPDSETFKAAASGLGAIGRGALSLGSGALSLGSGALSLGSALGSGAIDFVTGD